MADEPERRVPRRVTDKPAAPPARNPRRITGPVVARELPGLARAGAGELLRAATWVAVASANAGGKVVRQAVEGQTPAQIAQDAGEDLREVVRQALGLPDDSLPTGAQAEHTTRAELREKGNALLYRSADVRFDEDVHPAYERILDELAPDEARILRYLASSGPQPALDVRTGRPFGVGSTLVAMGLSMVGELAGCRHLDKSAVYLDNLHRLGLVWFSKETVAPGRYQVVEVQPVVTEALRAAGRGARTVRRSIVLTPFGEDFCRVCLPLEGTDR